MRKILWPLECPRYITVALLPIRLSYMFINYWIIFHVNNCKPTFVFPHTYWKNELIEVRWFAQCHSILVKPPALEFKIIILVIEDIFLIWKHPISNILLNFNYIILPIRVNTIFLSICLNIFVYFTLFLLLFNNFFLSFCYCDKLYSIEYSVRILEELTKWW